MDAVDHPRMMRGQRDRHARAKIAALRAEALVAKPAHQRRPQVRDLERGHAGLRGRRRKREARQRRRDDVEGVGGIGAERGRIAQLIEQRVKLEERPGPAVRDYERISLESRCDARGPPMREVHGLAVHVGEKLRQLVQLAFGRAPVELPSPIAREFAQPGRVGALLPRGRGRRGRPAGRTDAVAQIVDVLIGDRDLKRVDLHGGSSWVG
ncbi:putative membrane protein YccC [Paraburkholderia youngii]